MIQFENVTVVAGDFRLERISFEVPRGAYAVLVGRTGVGKTTLMEALCGLRQVESGVIRIGGRDVTAAPPRARGVGYVPQDVALFDHMPVRENVAFALRARGAAESACQSRVAALTDLLGIAHLANRKIAGLSGGERQRVALARALAAGPSVLALDEPLAALDEATRDQMCEVLRAAHAASGATVLQITHSTAEAERLGSLRLRLTVETGVAVDELPAAGSSNVSVMEGG